MSRLNYVLETTDGNGCCHPTELALWCTRCPERPVATTNAAIPFTKTLTKPPTLLKLSVLADDHEEEVHGG